LNLGKFYLDYTQALIERKEAHYSKETNNYILNKQQYKG